MNETSTTAVAHQFDDAGQQRDAATLGLWVFLVTEIMMFGGLFAGYTVYRNMYFQGFAVGSHYLDIRLGATNTAVLILSSFTMAMAVFSAQRGRRNALVAFLLVTMLLGGVFLGIKSVEYAHKFHEHLVPGPGFVSEGPVQQVYVFISFYFVMTGLHAVHMIVGIGILAVMVGRSLKGQFSATYNTPIELSGLYWHFVDIVWIFLYPLLYLIGRHVHT